MMNSATVLTLQTLVTETREENNEKEINATNTTDMAEELTDISSSVNPSATVFENRRKHISDLSFHCLAFKKIKFSRISLKKKRMHSTINEIT